jgi:hypothetical protein
MNISDADLELLGAYHDGELDQHEVREVQERLTREPALVSALAQIREFSGALRALRPPVPVQPHHSGLLKRRFHQLAAAMIAIAVLAGGIFYLVVQDPARSPEQWHREFLTRNYTVPSGTAITPVSQWLGREPDLSAANLTLVDVAIGREQEFYLHYSGENGCRLTFGSLPRKPELPEGNDRLLVEEWAAGGVYYSLLAVGMDRGKFAAVNKLLREWTRTKHLDQTVVAALREATSSALPCA